MTGISRRNWANNSFASPSNPSFRLCICSFA